MDEKRLLEQISQLIDSKLSASEERMNQRFKKIDQRFEEIENRLDVIQEDVAITRGAVNALIEWTEQVSVITQVRFPIKKPIQNREKGVN